MLLLLTVSASQSDQGIDVPKESLSNRSVKLHQWFLWRNIPIKNRRSPFGLTPLLQPSREGFSEGSVRVVLRILATLLSPS